MNKKEFVKGLADNMGVTQKEAAITFDCFMDQLMATIATGDKFTIVGFGSFYSEDKAARTARNPKTGEPIEVPAKRVPKFKYSEKFKKTIFAGGATEAKAETEVEEVEEAVEVEDDVKFDVYKAARTARNPKTGEPIEVPKFKYSEKFKKTIFAGGATEAKAEAEVEEIEEAVEVEDDVKFDVYDDEALSKLVDEQVVDESLIDDDPDIYVTADGEVVDLSELDD